MGVIGSGVDTHLKPRTVLGALRADFCHQKEWPWRKIKDER